MIDLPSDSRTALASLIRELTDGSATSIVEMPGGASTRRYFRVTREGQPWAVAMYVPDAAHSDEVTKHNGNSRTWPFIEVQGLLVEADVAVPVILGHALKSGILLLEDLGDDTLANYLLRHDDARPVLYRDAVRELARAQAVLASRIGGTVIGERRFDYDLLYWEVEHFREWALQARGVVLSETERAVFEAAAVYLARTISQWPYGFVHRDYQSRNLMVRSRANQRPQLVWIDFQDALLGPRVYDLVALLGDSYQSFTGEFIREMLDEYAAGLALGAEQRAMIEREFLTVMVQRKLKDAGRFVFLDRVKGKPEFLRFVEPTIDKALGALEQLTSVPELAELDALLRRSAK